MNTEFTRTEIATAMTALSAAWQGRRYDDLAMWFAPDMVFTLPGGAGHLAGPPAIVASYREFMDRITLISYRESTPDIEAWSDLAVVSFTWEMDWLADGVSNHGSGRDIFALRRAAGRWQAIWRTMSFDTPSE
jgi:hypothetical protein